jgi:hypothetical protein
MKLWLLSCNLCPNLFFKRKSSEEVLKDFKKGLHQPEKYINHPSFKITQLTLEKFLELVPDEFQIYDDTGF